MMIKLKDIKVGDRIEYDSWPGSFYKSGGVVERKAGMNIWIDTGGLRDMVYWHDIKYKNVRIVEKPKPGGE